jgi:hypothetical protein
MAGAQFARFPDTRERIAPLPPKPSLRANDKKLFPSDIGGKALAIDKRIVLFGYRDGGSGWEGIFVREYRVARIGEAGKNAFPPRADD